ncbi:hypothetical protein VTI74DRAFT_11289 [Chaetomium olivicolor]
MFHTIQNWERGEPKRHEYWTFRDGLWWPVEVHGSTEPPGQETHRNFQFSVLAWNIDFMRSFDDARMSAALSHLNELTRGPFPALILLNEMTKGDLKLIKAAEWIRERYNITDANTDHWESPSYGTTILVPRALPIKDVFRVHYARTSMQRDALFVDLALPDEFTLRICTSHLESLRSSPPKRPAQLATAAKYLHQAYAGIIGGDFNAIEEFDKTLHVENNLKDAYLEVGWEEGHEDGMTWGHMAQKDQRERFGFSRMDKIMFCGRVRLVGFGRFGLDIVVEDEEIAKQLMEVAGLEKAWVTDHLGVRAEFRMEMPESPGSGGGGNVAGGEEEVEEKKEGPSGSEEDGTGAGETGEEANDGAGQLLTPPSTS